MNLLRIFAAQIKYVLRQITDDGAKSFRWKIKVRIKNQSGIMACAGWKDTRDLQRTI